MGFRQFMKFRDEFADINWWPLGNLKQWRLHTHKQTGQFVILQHCLPPNFEVKTCQEFWKVWGVACGWLRVTHMSGWKWGIGLAAAALGAPTLYVYAQLYIYIRQHVYMIIISLCIYIYIHMYLIGNRICTHFFYVGFWVFSPWGRRSSLRCSGLRCFLDDRPLGSSKRCHQNRWSKIWDFLGVNRYNKYRLDMYNKYRLEID